MNEWLISVLGENAAKFVWFAALFIIFIIAATLIARLITQLSKRNRQDTYGDLNHSRLGVVDAAIIDEARKLILVRRDNMEHLLLIGGPNDLVVETYPAQEAAHLDYASSKIQPEQIERYSKNQDYQLDHDPAVAAGATISNYSETAQNYSETVSASIYPAENHAETAYQATPEQSWSQEQLNNSSPEFARDSYQNFEPSVPVAPSHQEPVFAESEFGNAPHIIPEVRNISAKPAGEEISTGQNHKEPSSVKKTSGAKIHPVYPLGQVSRAVVETSTQYASKYRTPEMPIPPTIVQPNAPQKSAPLKPAIEPQPIAAASMAAQSTNTDMDLASDFLNELENEFEKSFQLDDAALSTPAVDETAFDLGNDFEDELLASLDITPSDKTSKPSFEDEMERLLSDLTPDKNR